MENFTPNTPEDFQRQEKLINRIVELIEQGNPNLIFAVYASGKILEEGSGVGSTIEQGTFGYTVDKKTKRLTNNHNHDLMYLNQNVIKDRTKGEDNQKPYTIYTEIFKTSGYLPVPSITVSFRIPFHVASDENDFVRNRPGRFLSFALAFPSDPKGFQSFVESFKDEQMEALMRKHLNDITSQKAHTFFRLLFFKCAEKWFPKYWAFFKEQIKLNGQGMQDGPVYMAEETFQTEEKRRVRDWKVTKLR